MGSLFLSQSFLPHSAHIHISVHRHGDAGGFTQLHLIPSALLSHTVLHQAGIFSAEAGIQPHGFLHRGVDEDDLLRCRVQIGHTAAVDRTYQGIPHPGGHVGLVGGKVFVGHFSFQTDLPIPVPEGQILPYHGFVILRDAIDTDGDLGNGEKNARQLEGGTFHGFLGMPHSHIGMNGGISAHLTEMEYVQPVAKAVIGGIAGRRLWRLRLSSSEEGVERDATFMR